MIKAGWHSEESQNAELKRYAVWPLVQSDRKTESSGNPVRGLGENGRVD